jgi:hypothetical protein
MHNIRVIIVVVHVGAVKIYVAALEALSKEERGMKLSLPPKANSEPAPTNAPSTGCLL